MRRLIAAVLISFMPLAAGAQDETPARAGDPRIDDAVAAWKVWVEDDLGVDGVPGASFAFVHKGELLASGADVAFYVQEGAGHVAPDEVARESYFAWLKRVLGE